MVVRAGGQLRAAAVAGVWRQPRRAPAPPPPASTGRARSRPHPRCSRGLRNCSGGGADGWHIQCLQAAQAASERLAPTRFPRPSPPPGPQIQPCTAPQARCARRGRGWLVGRGWAMPCSPREATARRHAQTAKKRMVLVAEGGGGEAAKGMGGVCGARPLLTSGARCARMHQHEHHSPLRLREWRRSAEHLVEVGTVCGSLDRGAGCKRCRRWPPPPPHARQPQPPRADTCGILLASRTPIRAVRCVRQGPLTARAWERAAAPASSRHAGAHREPEPPRRKVPAGEGAPSDWRATAAAAATACGARRCFCSPRHAARTQCQHCHTGCRSG